MVDLRGALRSPAPNKFGFDFCRFALGLQEEHLLSATVERASDHPAADKEIFRPTFHILQRALHSARKIFGSSSPLSSTGVFKAYFGRFAPSASI